jgi:hypothetical protein
VNNSAFRARIFEYETIFEFEDGWRKLVPLGRNLTLEQSEEIEQYREKMRSASSADGKTKPNRGGPCITCGWIHPKSYRLFRNPHTGEMYTLNAVQALQMTAIHEAMAEEEPGLPVSAVTTAGEQGKKKYRARKKGHEGAVAKEVAQNAYKHPIGAWREGRDPEAYAILTDTPRRGLIIIRPPSRISQHTVNKQ